MKKIECFISPEREKSLIEALQTAGVGGVTSYPVRGFGKQNRTVSGSLLPKVKFELLVLETEYEKIIDIIFKTAQTGGFGSGKIAVYNIENVIRIRTGETGAKALY